MSARRGVPRRLGASLEGLAPEVAPLTPLAAIQAVWREVVGPQAGAASAPVALRDEVLVVACVSSAWAQELDLMQSQIARGLSERLGEEPGFRSFRFRLGELP